MQAAAMNARFRPSENQTWIQTSSRLCPQQRRPTSEAPPFNSRPDMGNSHIGCCCSTSCLHRQRLHRRQRRPRHGARRRLDTRPHDKLRHGRRRPERHRRAHHREHRLHVLLLLHERQAEASVDIDTDAIPTVAAATLAMIIRYDMQFPVCVVIPILTYCPAPALGRKHIDVSVGKPTDNIVMPKRTQGIVGWPSQ